MKVDRIPASIDDLFEQVSEQAYGDESWATFYINPTEGESVDSVINRFIMLSKIPSENIDKIITRDDKLIPQAIISHPKHDFKININIDRIPNSNNGFIVHTSIIWPKKDLA